MAVIEVNQQNLRDTIENNDFVIIDFWAPWCGPCQSFGPVFEATSEKHADVVFAKVNTDEHSEWASKFGVQGIPTMMFFANGKLIHRQVGALPEPVLKDVLTQFLEVVEEAEEKA